MVTIAAGHIGELGYPGHCGGQVVLLSALMSASTFLKHSSCIADVIFKVAIFYEQSSLCIFIFILVAFQTLSFI